MTTVRAEIAAAEHRASIQAGTVRTLLVTESDTARAEQALFHELDGLARLRGRLQTLEALRGRPLNARKVVSPDGVGAVRSS